MTTAAISSASPDLAAATTAGKPPRLLSLDVFRGLTILGMILVNNPGSSPVYEPLEHAEWFGWTPTDLIFPFFLFIVGTSLSYSLRKYRDGQRIDPAVYWRIVRRTLLLIFLGWMPSLMLRVISLANHSATTFNLETLRIFGVLVRIALVYFAASLIVLHLSVRKQIVLGVAILLGYWALLGWLPNPHDYAANLSIESNLVREVDVKLIGEPHMYTYDSKTEKLRERTDPEGLLSTLPAVVTALIGYWVGLFIQRKGINWGTVAVLIAWGLACYLLGEKWGEYFPVSKKLWTSSFVVLTGGLAMVALAACLALFDIENWRKLARPFEIVGINAIFVFVASGLVGLSLGRFHVAGGDTGHAWLYHHLFTSWIHDPQLASLGYALATVAFWWIVLWIMSRLGWSIRV